MIFYSVEFEFPNAYISRSREFEDLDSAISFARDIFSCGAKWVCILFKRKKDCSNDL